MNFLKNILDKLTGSLKAIITLICLAIASVALFLGKMDGASYVELVKYVVASFTISHGIQVGMTNLMVSPPNDKGITE